MSNGEWIHFLTISVKGRPPFFGPGTDPKDTVHVQYPLVQALERAAAEAARIELKNNIPSGTVIKLEITCKRFDYDSGERVNAPRIIGGISNVLQGVNFLTDKDIREVSYSEEALTNGASEGYEVGIYQR